MNLILFEKQFNKNESNHFFFFLSIQSDEHEARHNCHVSVHPVHLIPPLKTCEHNSGFYFAQNNDRDYEELVSALTSKEEKTHGKKIMEKGCIQKWQEDGYGGGPGHYGDDGGVCLDACAGICSIRGNRNHSHGGVLSG
jgi:hypothetical protein